MAVAERVDQVGAATLRGPGCGSVAAKHLSKVHKSPLDGTGTVRNAVGGSVLRVQLPCRPGRKIGGKRGKVGGYSRASRRGLYTSLNEIDRTRVPGGSVAMVTLTWPAVYPSPEVAKVVLDRFVKRLGRMWGRTALCWKLEPQERGAPHFHLLVFWGKTLDQAGRDVRAEWCARAWYDLAGGGDPNHLKFHRGQLGNRPCHEVIGSWEQVLKYAGKYVGKAVEIPEEPEEESNRLWEWGWPGRWWAWRYPDLLPKQVVAVQVPVKVAYLVKRVCRRYIEHQKIARWKIDWRDMGGPVERRYMDKYERELWQAAGPWDRRQQYRRRLRRGREDGERGITCYVPDAEARRVVRWAWATVLEKCNSGVSVLV